MNIYLVGFMGTGKSSTGRVLAEKMGYDFVDLDSLIESQERRRIADIFSKEGEKYFRKIEKRALKQVSLRKGIVVACGGGAVLDDVNVRVMKKTGKMVCLSASVDEIIKRVSGSKNRPLLRVSELRSRVESLLKARSSRYGMSDTVIDTSGLSVRQAAGKIKRYLSAGK